MARAKAWAFENGLDDRFHETGIHGTESVFVDSSFEFVGTRIGIMATWRQAVELAMTEEEIETLTALSRSRTEPPSISAG
jgi:hypothetical protein